MNKLIPLLAVSVMSMALIGTAYTNELEDKQKELVANQQEVVKTQQEIDKENLKVTEKRVDAANKSMLQISRASKIIGTKVTSPKGESLGNIKELVIDPESGRIVYAVVSFGGLFGLGNKLFALPWNTLHWSRDKQNYLLDVTKETLKKAPGFDKKHWPDSTDKWDLWQEQIEQFYRVKP